MLLKVLLPLFTLLQLTYCEGEAKTKEFKKVDATYTYASGNSRIFVFDNMINPKLAQVMRQFLVTNQSYSYMYPDPYELGKDNRKANDGNLHWSAPVPPQLLIKSRFWTGVRNAYRSLPDEIIQGRRYLPYVAHGTMLQRGDYTIPFKGDVQRNDSIFVRIFLTKGMPKNIYSDQTFYDENDEIIASVHPKLARMVIWTGNDVSTLIRPPSMGYEKAEYSMLIKLSPHQELFENASIAYTKHQKEIELHHKLPFPFTNHVNKFQINQKNLSEHLLGKFYDRHGNVIAMFDNILTKEVLDELRTYLTHYERGFSYSAYDPASSETHDNVNCILGFKIEKVLNTPYWEAVKVLSAYLSNTTQWYPYDVSCNLIQHTHHTRIHLDCTNQEFEYTFLLYLNPNWNENMYAETAFFDYEDSTLRDTSGKMDEKYDFIAATVPKFGRIAIFRNLIPHSARPPSPSFLAARYTFPVKVAESFRQARAKMLMEALDYKSPDMPDDPLYEPLRQGQYEAYLKDDKRDWVEEHYKKMIDSRDGFQHKEVKAVLDMLIPEKYRSAAGI